MLSLVGHYLNYPSTNCFSNMVNNKEGLKSEYTTDGVHPSEGGYKVMSKIANNFILRNLN